MLVIIYLRVSTEEQAKKGFSLPDQREACLARAQEIARELDTDLAVREFVDTFGGDVLERPVLEDLRAFVRANRPAWFICMDPDRFSRSLTAQLLITDEIERAGTRLAFVQHNYEKSAEGRLFYQLRGAVAEFEKAKILERTGRGKRRKLREGRRSNGAAPFGYRHNFVTDELEIYEPEAQWVRLLFRWVAEEQLSYYQIVRRLRELGVATKKGGTWREATVAYILKNTTYIGEMICNRYDSVGQSAYRRLPRAKRGAMTHRERPEAEWIVAPVPALIDRATFAAVQSLLGTYVRRGGPRSAHLLSMLLRCGRCGAGMSYCRKGYVRCNRRFADLRNYADPTRCTMPHIRVDAIEEAVWAAVCRWLTAPELLAAYQAAPGPGPAAPEAPALRQQLEEKQREQVLIIRKQMKGLLTEETADAMLAEAGTRIRHLEARLEELRHRPAKVGGHQGEAPGVAERLAGLDPALRVRLIRQIVRSVRVNEDGSWSVDAQV